MTDLTAPRVKPLVWANESFKNSWPNMHRAVTPIAEYSVCGTDGKDDWRWYRNGYNCGTGSQIERSLKSAMDAASEHHVGVVKSCLEATE